MWRPRSPQRPSLLENLAPSQRRGWGHGTFPALTGRGTHDHEPAKTPRRLSPVLRPNPRGCVSSPSPSPAGPLASRALQPPPVGASAPSVSGLGVPCPPSPVPFSGARSLDQSPPSGTLFPSSFLPPFPPSISLPSTGNSEAAPKLASRRRALRPCPCGIPTHHLRLPLAAHSPARALPRRRRGLGL